MKRLFLLIILLTSLELYAQNNIDSLRRRIDTLESALKEKNYVRIPIGDLDSTLESRVQSEVFKYIAVFGVLLLGGSFSVYRILQNEFKKNVEEEVEKKYQALNKDIDEIKENSRTQLKDINDSLANQRKEFNDTLKKENDRQDVAIKTISDNISNMATRQDAFLNDITGHVEKKISEATRTIWNDIADNKLRTAKDSQYLGARLAKEINEFLDNPAIQINVDKKQQLVDALMRCFYYATDKDLQASGFETKYNEMTRLLKKYEGKLELLPETYANAAIAFTNVYEFYNKPEDKNFCIDCCDKALLKSKDYGIPFALKLEIYSIDYSRAFDQQQKTESHDKIKRLLHEINIIQNNSPYLPVDTLDRLLIDKNVKYLKSYIELLEKLFSDDILSLKEKACKNIISSAEEIKRESSKKLFFQLLSDAAATNTLMDGVWVARKSVSAGIETPPSQLDIKITISKYQYWLTSGGKTDSGYIHYLPYSKHHAINLYILNATGEYVQTVYCISSIEPDGTWRLCSNYLSEERPEDFSSTAENKYYLDELIKINQPNLSIPANNILSDYQFKS